jgi:hypothetical protein
MRLRSTLACALVCGNGGIVGSQIRLVIFAGAPGVPLQGSGNRARVSCVESLEKALCRNHGAN